MRFILLAAFTMIAQPDVALAQGASNPISEPLDGTTERLPDSAPGVQTSLIQDESDAYEEIVVIGDRSLTELREELRAAEDKVHELFNALNDDDQFDIHCHIETRTGTNISRRVCKPNYVDTATRNSGQAYLNFLRGEFGGAAAPSVAVIRYKNGILQEKMTALVDENAELRGAVFRYSQLSNAFDSARQRILYTND